MLHRAELGQIPPALLFVAEGIDHPGNHVVNGHVSGGRGTSLRQFLEDESRIEPRQSGAPDILSHVDGRKTERRGLAQWLDRENLFLVPLARKGHHLLACKGSRQGLKSTLFLVELEIHGRTE
jgi:hypothetical protein